MPRLARAAALVIVAAALAAQTAAQPAVGPRPYSAFPDLKTPTRPTDTGDGTAVEWPEVGVLHVRLLTLAERPVPPDAAPAARVRAARLKAAADFFRRTHVRRLVGAAGTNTLVEVTGMVNDVYRTAADGEPDAARRGLAEERVRVLKELERQTDARVEAGVDHPADLALVRFHRLAAEGDLLALIGGK